MQHVDDIAVLGIPLDSNSSYQRGAALAPEKIREALFCDSSNLFTENRIDLGKTKQWQILPDLVFPDDSAFDHIENKFGDLLQQNKRVIALGGDHSVTIPIIRAYARTYPGLNILHFDAHPDLYDELDGNRNSHASTFARIMEEGLAARLVQVGIRTMTQHQYEQAQRFGVEVIDMKKIGCTQTLSFDGPVYISLDMDCLDPACAPGVSHHEPGGMSTRDVLGVVQNLEATVVGADIVEYNPKRDVNGMTGMVAGKLLKEILAKIMESAL